MQAAWLKCYCLEPAENWLAGVHWLPEVALLPRQLVTFCPKTRLHWHARGLNSLLVWLLRVPLALLEAQPER
jgi:hypothetical protein